MKKNSVLLFLSAILFALSEPSLVFADGCSFCAFCAYVPFFLLCERIPVKKSFFWGGAFGFFSYLLLCPWLSSFGLIALLFVCLLFAFYNSILCFAIAFSGKNLPQKIKRFHWILRAFFVLLLEIAQTHGFLGFSYGIIGYSQWKNPVFLRFASVFGVFGVSFVLLVLNSLVAKIIAEKCSPKLILKSREVRAVISVFMGIFLFWGAKSVFLGNKTPESSESQKSRKTLKIALIQNASSAASHTISDFEKDAETLMSLTDSALEAYPGTELVVWAETAVVPDILYHYENQKDERRHSLAKKIMRYIRGKNCAFLIGNNHFDGGKTHNSALFFSQDSEEIEVYDKNLLVPFTEYWPSFLDFDVFDGLKKTLNCDFFSPGAKITIFALSGMSFAVPICFEDLFSPFIKRMKERGADFFISLSDDAWAGERAAQNMHLSMSVFRAAEFSSPFVRATIDGKTCAINSDGKIISELEPGIDGFLFVEIP